MMVTMVQILGANAGGNNVRTIVQILEVQATVLTTNGNKNNELKINLKK